MPSENIDRMAGLISPTTTIEDREGTRTLSDGPQQPTNRLTVNRVWGVSPGYPKQLRDNPYHLTKVEQNGSDWVIESDNSYTGVMAWRSERRTIVASSLSGFGWSYLLSPEDGDVVSTAVNALRNNIRGTSVSLPTILAEAGQTCKLITNTAITLAEAYTSLRRGNFPAALRRLGAKARNASSAAEFRKEFGRDARNAAANAWLGISYGWKPLIQDVYDSAQTLARLQTDDNTKVCIAEGRATKSASKSGSRNGEHYSQSDTVFRKYKARYCLREDSPPIAMALGLVNPLEVVWEIIPFSFVVDWFLPVGDALSSLGSWSEQTHQFLGGTCVKGLRSEYSISRTRSSSGTEELYDYNTYRSYSHSWRYMERKDARAKALILDRDVLGGIPTPELPHFKDPLGLSHLASALSLLNNSFKR